MENNSIATLKDYQTAIKRSVDKIKSNLSKFDQAMTSQQNTALRAMTEEHNLTKTNISLMKMELSNLQEEANVTAWQNIISELQFEIDSLKPEIEKKNQMKQSLIDSDDVQIDTNKMSIKQAFHTGDKILKDDDDAIKRMIKTASTDKNTMKEVNKELNRQQEALENADKDLTEIDFSLKRAGEQIKIMFRMYATDKLIMCLVMIIILAILAIIIMSLIEGDGDSITNLPNDPFGTQNKTTATS